LVAQLAPIDLVAPGFRGLNLAQSGSLLEPSFATRADNAVIDRAGRLAARAGFSDITTTDISDNPEIKTLFEYRTADGDPVVIAAWDGGIADDVADPENNDISGDVTDSDGNWWFQNFNNKVIGFQDGQKPIVYSGTGTFATVTESDGTAPTSLGGVGLAAFGRVWAVDSDGHTIKYSGLLDETDWGGVGAGSIDMHNVWTDGTDTVMALAAFNGALVVFGRRHIVFWVDGQGSELGLNPDNIYVADVITGTGCLSQWSIQPVGETDLLFLSRNGVQSLGRVIQEKSNPVTNLSKSVRNSLIDSLRAVAATSIRSAYSPELGFYLLTVPGSVTWVLDQSRRYRDSEGDELSIVTKWDLAPYSWLVRSNGDIYLGGSWGVGLYGGTDDAGAPFRLSYESPWLDLGEDFGNRLKMLKRLGAILFVTNSTDIVFKWSVDFDEDFRSITRSVESDASSEWGIAEYSVDEFAGGLSLRLIRAPARDKGQYFRLALEAEVTGTFAIQQIELFAKMGRLA
jgi:hypothetical protein